MKIRTGAVEAVQTVALASCRRHSGESRPVQDHLRLRRMRRLCSESGLDLRSMKLNTD